MLHWIPAPAVAFLGARKSPAVLPGDVTDRCVQNLRGMHALMLAYAAQRRRAAGNPEDRAYWKAAESCALDKARGIREQAGFERLP